MNSSSVSPLEVRELMKPFTRRSNTKALAMFALDLLIYCGLIGWICFTENLGLKLALSLILGLVIGLLFIVGHDCCHKSFTSSHRLNRILGAICFMPSLHNFDLWELGHNKTHHAFTNYKDKDYVYTPLSVTEYLRLKPLQKGLYQLYRTIPGHLFYYAIEIWFKKMLIPHKGIPGMTDKSRYQTSIIPLLIYLIIIHLALGGLSLLSGNSFLSCWTFGFLIPFLAWNWLMGFVIYQHHTNPHTHWFADQEEWNYWEVQVGHSTHIKFPKPLNHILHNIMEHTAHHSNMMIPLYNLPKAQAEIETHFGEKIQVVNWNWAFYWHSIRTCKLYDYKNHRWLGFKAAKELEEFLA